MSNGFIKVERIGFPKVEYVLKHGNNFYASDRCRQLMLDLNSKKTAYINLSEVASMEMEEMEAWNPELLEVRDGVLSLKGSKESYYRYEGQDVPDEIFSVKVGVIMMKHGISTNLGLNGMDVNQFFIVTKESYEKIVKIIDDECERA